MFNLSRIWFGRDSVSHFNGTRMRVLRAARKLRVRCVFVRRFHHVVSEDGGRRVVWCVYAYVYAQRWASVVVRSYLGYYAGSHQNSAAKRPWARIVLPWVTRWEVLVSYPFCILHFCPVNDFALYPFDFTTFHEHGRTFSFLSL